MDWVDRFSRAYFLLTLIAYYYHFNSLLFMSSFPYSPFMLLFVSVLLYHGDGAGIAV